MWVSTEWVCVYACVEKAKCYCGVQDSRPVVLGVHCIPAMSSWPCLSDRGCMPDYQCGHRKLVSTAWRLESVIDSRGVLTATTGSVHATSSIDCNLQWSETIRGVTHCSADRRTDLCRDFQWGWCLTLLIVTGQYQPFYIYSCPLFRLSPFRWPLTTASSPIS